MFDVNIPEGKGWQLSHVYLLEFSELLKLIGWLRRVVSKDSR